MLEVGEKAPDFDLATDDGRIRLAQLRGKPVVVFFYPKDDTSGCTTEARDFTALYPEFQAAGAEVIGISPDSAASHGKFRTKHELAVQLAADEDKAVAQAYGVWVEKSMYGRKYMGVERTTLLIGADGRIVDIWRKVKVPGHAAAVLQAVHALQS